MREYSFLLLFKIAPEILSRIGLFAGCHLLGSSLCDDSTAAVAALGSQINNMIGNLDDVEVVLNDQNGITLIRQPLEHIYELVDVCCVKSRCWLVKDVYGISGRSL